MFYRGVKKGEVLWCRVQVEKSESKDGVEGGKGGESGDG